MTSPLLDDRRSLQTLIDRNAYDLFKGKEGEAPFQVTSILHHASTTATAVGTKNIAKSSGGAVFVKNRNLWDIIATDTEKAEEETGNAIQIFTIRQDRSWATLNIQREAFEAFMKKYQVFPSFWKCMFVFGRKTMENEFLFPGIGKRKRRRGGVGSRYSYEFSYVLRRVEDNGRSESEDHSWSIRQTAIYHQISPPGSLAEERHTKSTMLLVAPSANAELRYTQYLEDAVLGTRIASAWNVHRVLVADSIRGWGVYMASLEKRLKKRSDRIVLATVGTSKENLSPLTDFVINFEDRQELKILEDAVVGLEIIIPTQLRIVKEIRKQCEFCSDEEAMTWEESVELQSIRDEFDEYIAELELCQERVATLNGKAKSTAQLLSDLLSYEEAVALKELTRKSQQENSSMIYLAEKSTKDAAAVKILTVITLIYLPTTIVANFFSTEFVQTDVTGQMSLAKNFWLLFAIAIPLTAFTIFVWWAWVRFTKVPDLSSTPPEFTRQHSFKSVMSGSKKKRKEDLERGLKLGNSPPPFADSAVGTWSTMATTVKDG